MTAPELSDAERAIVEKFEAAEYPREVLLAGLGADLVRGLGQAEQDGGQS